MARTETYRAPEFDVPYGRISRSSDIFSLGCAFLEFVTWYMEGHHSASEDFVTQRLELDPENGFDTDTFFRIEDRRGSKRAVIKSGVKTWIQRLRQRPDCSNYINDFLELIESRMLEPEPKNRWDSYKVVKRLELFSQTCRADTSYWKEPKGP
jgi:serine/threonine protein kinase